MARRRCTKTGLYEASRSLMRYRGAWSHGKASVIWRAIHSAVGFRVTPNDCVYRKLDSAIVVVKAAEDGLRCDGADALNRAMERGVLIQRSMSPQLIIIGGICAEDSAKVRFTKHDHVVQTLPADRADEPVCTEN